MFFQFSQSRNTLLLNNCFFFSVNLVIIGVIFALAAEKLGTKFLVHSGSSITLHGLNSVF